MPLTGSTVKPIKSDVESTHHDERNLRELLKQLEHAKTMYAGNAMLTELLDQRIRTIRAQLDEMESLGRRSGNPRNRD